MNDIGKQMSSSMSVLQKKRKLEKLVDFLAINIHSQTAPNWVC